MTKYAPIGTASSTHPDRGGMTLIEVLIIIAAIAIVAVISIPGSTMVLEHYRLKQASGELLGGLNLARETAIRDDATVRVCPTSNGRSCNSDGDWDQGWLVFADANGDGVAQQDERLQAFGGPGQRVYVVATGAVRDLASFRLEGLIAREGYDSGRFHVCHEGQAARGKTIQVDSDGWVQAFPIEKGLTVCKRG